MTDVTEKAVEAGRNAGLYTWGKGRDILSTIDAAIAAALAAQTSVSIRCPECAKANAARDERFGRKP